LAQTGAIDPLALQRWREGILFRGKKTLPAQVEILKQTDQKTLLEVILVEGESRQIRCVAEDIRLSRPETSIAVPSVSFN
jgi:23S rRNA pseudouridine2605 synthase